MLVRAWRDLRARSSMKESGCWRGGRRLVGVGGGGGVGVGLGWGERRLKCGVK